MQFSISSEQPTTTSADAIVIPVTKTERLPKALRTMDDALDGQLAHYIDSEEFRGKRDQLVRFPARGIGAARVLLIGLGDERELDAQKLRSAAGLAAKSLIAAKARRVAMLAPTSRRVRPEEAAQAIAEGIILGGYRFDQYKTTNSKATEIERFTLLADGRQAGALRKGVKLGTVLAESALLARDLSNEPGSVHTPEWMAKQARALGREHGLKVTVLAERELRREKMGGILAVGRGSANPPRLIAMEYGAPARGARRRPRLAIVGKGITFDTGGISIKPSPQMDEMKHDMSGGAAVFGAMRAVALLKLPLHVIGIVAAAQNMPDGDAYLPGDVVTASNGKTIEVLNTDAEGRVVLADALHYAAGHEPDAIIDLATLTGACVIALGEACCAVMGNDDKLVERLRAAGQRCHERAWPLPLWDEHKKLIEGSVGDIKNVGGRTAGVSTAGAFLSHFVGDTPWAHLDIAGTAWTTSDLPYAPKGATGFGVRLLLDLMRHWK